MTKSPVNLLSFGCWLLPVTPGLTGMNPVAALSADDLYNALNPPLKDTSMNEQLRQLLTALGLTVADGDEFTPELGTAALSALTGSKPVRMRTTP